MRAWKQIIVHCSDTPNGRNVTKEDIERWHVRDNGWRDIGYHAVVEIDGTVVKGRNESMPGAHCKGHNTTALGICLVGRDKFTIEQFEGLYEQVREWMVKYHIPITSVRCHYEYSDSKTCPNIAKNLLLAMLAAHDIRPVEDHLFVPES